MRNFVYVFVLLVSCLTWNSFAFAGVLALYEEEKEEHKLARILTVTEEFFSENGDEVLTLAQQNFFNPKETPAPPENVETIHGTLRRIVQGRSHLVQHYRRNLKKFHQELGIIRNELRQSVAFPGLEEDELETLSTHTAILHRIVSYIRLHDIGLEK